MWGWWIIQSKNGFSTIKNGCPGKGESSLNSNSLSNEIIENKKSKEEQKPTENKIFTKKQIYKEEQQPTETKIFTEKEIKYIKGLNDRKIKICLFGRLNAEKSEIIYRFLNYNSLQEHAPTIEDVYSCNIIIEGIEFEIEILDTAGEEDYRIMMDMWISFGEGFLLVFDITDYEGFEILKVRYDRILREKHKKNGGEIPILLVGNKKGLENKRKVTVEEATKLANSWGTEYIEICSKTNFMCKECFEKISKEVLKVKLKQFKKGKKTFKKDCNIY